MAVELSQVALSAHSLPVETMDYSNIAKQKYLIRVLQIPEIIKETIRTLWTYT